MTASVLRAAGGTVRCGRCGSAFNALAWLSDTLPPFLVDGRNEPAPAETAAAELSAGPVTVTEFHFTADDIEKVFVDARSWQQAVTDSAEPRDIDQPPGFGAEPPVVLVTESQPFEDITLEGDRISIESLLEAESDLDSTDEFAVLREVPDSAYPEEEPAPAASTAGPPPEPLPAATEAAAAELVVTEPVAAELAAAEPAREELAAAAELHPWEAMQRRRATDAPYAGSDSAPRRSGRSMLAWSMACLLLAVALLAQLVHQYRQELVRHPQAGPLLEDLYSRLGSPLSPNWNLDAFELRQWGPPADADASGRLTVRASIRNQAAFAQPHPILRLELDDRYGESVAVRDFEPAEYLKNPAEASRLIGPGASTEAELEIVEPSSEAVGYQLDVCLRESPSLLRCAGSRG